MIDAPLALAFTAGLVATVNPCGFAMLPAYLSYFLGIEGATSAEEDPRASVGTALVVGATVSLGFLVVFGIVGALVNAGVQSFIDYVKWATIAIGIGLVVLGIAMLRGYHLPFSTPRLDKGGRNRTLGSVFLFGVSYAIASISCTLPVFLALVFSTFSRTNFASGMATFLAYALGMALVLMALTVALALAKQSLVRSLRGAMRYIDRVAGALLIIAGGYLIYYWTFNIATDYSSATGSGPITFVEDLSARIATNIQDWGAGRVGFVLTVAIVGSAWYAVSRRRDSAGRR